MKVYQRTENGNTRRESCKREPRMLHDEADDWGTGALFRSGHDARSHAASADGTSTDMCIVICMAIDTW